MLKTKPRKKGMEFLTVNLDCRQLRTEYLEGEKYLVAPVVLMTPGVHEGSKGALLYRDKELGDYAPAWNHKPLVLNHPKKGIACTAKFLNRNKMGILLETDFDRGKQRAEAWFNERRTATVSPAVLAKLKRKEQMEVSTGLFVDQRGEPGKFKGKRYKAIAANHKPDHLAILPDSEGACSIKDGGGLFQLNAKRKSRIRKYVQKTLSKMLRNTKRKENSMSKTKIKKKDFVTRLIKNEQTTFDEKDRGWLMNMEPSQLRKLMPKKTAHIFETDEELEEVINEKLEDRLAELKRKNKKKELRKANRLAANAQDDSDDDADEDEEDDDDETPAKHTKKDKGDKQDKGSKGKPAKKKPNLKQFLENEVPDQLRPILKQALRAAASEEERLIKKIVANKASKFKAEDLKKLAPRLGSSYLDHLRSLAEMATNSAESDEEDDSDGASYFGAAAPAMNSDTSEGDDEGASEGQELPLPVYNNSRFAKGLKLNTFVPAGVDDDEEDDSMDDDS